MSKWHFDYSWAAARADLLAGATVAAIAIPQGMAYALIAGVDPRFGLYSAIMVTIIASVLGSSSHLINGPTNAISLVVFSALASFDGRSDAYQAMFLLGIIVGIIQILIAVFKLGDLTRYVSESVILGFMAGAGLLVAIGQVGNFLGAGSKKGSGDHSVIVRFWETLTQGGPFSPYAIGLGAGTIIAVLLLRRVINKYQAPADGYASRAYRRVGCSGVFWLVHTGGGRKDACFGRGQGTRCAAGVLIPSQVRMDHKTSRQRDGHFFSRFDRSARGRKIHRELYATASGLQPPVPCRGCCESRRRLFPVPSRIGLADTVFH